MSIRSQDDYELIAHIERSWQSIVESVAELNERNYHVALTDHHGNEYVPTYYKMEFRK